MTIATTATTYLQQRSALQSRQTAAARRLGVLVIGSDDRSSARIAAVVRSVLGYEAAVEIAASLGAGLDRLLATEPALVLVEDGAPPRETVEAMLRVIVGCGYRGRILAILASRLSARTPALLSQGASATIDRDAFDAISFAEAIAGVEGDAVTVQPCEPAMT
jgi:hypothetical protein